MMVWVGVRPPVGTDPLIVNSGTIWKRARQPVPRNETQLGLDDMTGLTCVVGVGHVAEGHHAGAGHVVGRLGGATVPRGEPPHCV